MKILKSGEGIEIRMSERGREKSGIAAIQRRRDLPKWLRRKV